MLLTWCRINSSQANLGKFQFVVLRKKKTNSVKLKKKIKKVVLLGITIGNLLIYVALQIINYMHYEEK